MCERYTVRTAFKSFEAVAPKVMSSGGMSSGWIVGKVVVWL